MLMNIKCKPATSLDLELKFDDNSVKKCQISVGDLVYIEYNKNGCRRRVEGKVLKISTNGTDPKQYYIIIDGSEDFESTQVRICPMNILDCEVIAKASHLNGITTPKDGTGIPFLRQVNGLLEFSRDGKEWLRLKLIPDEPIKPENGTSEPPHRPSYRDPEEHYRPSHRDPDDYYDDDVISDEIY